MSEGVACPQCGNTGSDVKDSRSREDGNYIRRRRMCRGCEHRFTTYERVVADGDNEDALRSQIFDALMAKAAELQELARTVLPGRMAGGIRRMLTESRTIEDDES